MLAPLPRNPAGPGTVPEISPVPGSTDRHAGSPVAVQLRACPVPESVACTCRLAAAPTVPVWLPGLVTVTVFPPPEPEAPAT